MGTSQGGIVSQGEELPTTGSKTDPLGRTVVELEYTTCTKWRPLLPDHPHALITVHMQVPEEERDRIQTLARQIVGVEWATVDAETVVIAPARGHAEMDAARTIAQEFGRLMELRLHIRAQRNDDLKKSILRYSPKTEEDDLILGYLLFALFFAPPYRRAGTYFTPAWPPHMPTRGDDDQP